MTDQCSPSHLSRFTDSERAVSLVGPREGLDVLREKISVRAIKLNCGMCAALMGIYCENFMSLQILVEKYRN